MNKENDQLRQKAEQAVLRVRGSLDVPGFEACVEAEFRRLKSNKSKDQGDK